MRYGRGGLSSSIVRPVFVKPYAYARQWVYDQFSPFPFCSFASLLVYSIRLACQGSVKILKNFSVSPSYGWAENFSCDFSLKFLAEFSP